MKTDKKVILKIWRQLGLLDGLKNDGIIEWRCAKSFNLMSEYILNNKNVDKRIIAWEVVIFPIIRRSLTKNTNRITKVIKPKELIDFLINNKIDNFLSFIINSVRKEKTKYIIECFSRYLDGIDCLNNTLIDLLTIINDEERNKINYLFDCDYEAEVCYYIAEYYCKYEKDKVI